MIQPLLRQRLLVVPALIYLVVAVACTQVPLLNYLGYEFSFLTALVASFVAGFLTIAMITAVRERHPDDADVPEALGAFRRSLLLNLALLIIPLAVMTTNALFVKNCSLPEGLAFFVLLPAVSVVFSSSLGFFCAAHYRHAKTVFTVFAFATLAEVLAVGYFTPAIFSYNFFFGYFPGVTYDEALTIGWSIVLFRIFTLLMAAGLVWMALLLLRHTRRGDLVWQKGVTLLGVMVQGRNVFIAAALATLVIVTWWFRGELGFDSTSRFIQKSLGATYQTSHFRIYYAPKSYDDTEIRWVAAEHEFRLKQICDVLNVQFRGTIESYVYPSAQVKQRLMGAGNTNIAKPWSGQIHITKQSLDGTLKHELVHVVAAPFGLPVIDASLSTGLVEGLAMAIEWNWGNRTLHQYAAAMKKYGAGPDITGIMSLTGFASQSSSVSYVLAGSFCRYLMDTYGIRRLMLLYGNIDYRKYYGKSLPELVGEWRGFLETIPVAEQERDVIDVLFRRPPIFRKVCARVLAARNQEAGRKFAERHYADAAQLFMQSYEEGRAFDALGGYIASAVRARNFAGVAAVFDTVVHQSSNPAEYLPMFVNIGLAESAEGDTSLARQLFTRVVIANVGESLTEAALVCDAAMSDAAGRNTFLHYFLDAVTDSQRVMILDSMIVNPEKQWLPLYLKGNVLLRMQQWQDALDTLRPLVVPEPILEAQRERAVGRALFRLRKFEEAKVAFWNSLNFVSSDVARNTVDDWIERCNWVTEHVAYVKEVR